ncbi:MAG: ATP-binding protein [Proteobacteria bacterium]|nr:ATP-binding protein [Pseudomonadota bacterium]
MIEHQFNAEGSILELIARGAELGRVLHVICVGLELELFDVRCVVMVATPGGHELELDACPSMPSDHSTAISRVKVGPLAASCGTAAYRGEPVGVLDPTTNPTWEGFHDLARQHDVGAVWSFPLFGPRRDVRGTVGVHFRVPRTPTPAERATIDRGVWLAEIALEQRHATEALRESEARYRAASQAKDEFLAMLGHELRNPLAPLQTVLDVMKLRSGDQLLKERTLIERQVRQLSRLVDDLLDMSRVAQGMIELRIEPTDLAEVVARAIETVAPLLEERRQTIDVSVAPNLVVHGDGARLRQVIGNLLTNASKYTPAGGHIAIIGAVEGEAAVVRVRDNGIGLSADTLPHIFEMFVQERQALDRSRGGLGLGLAIVKNLVELHHGSVEARSDGPGQGSVFTVRLPTVVAKGPSLGPDTQPDQDPRRQPVSPRPLAERTILIVDDNPDVRDTLVDLLEHLGFRPVSAHDGPSALVVVATARPSIGLVDLGLPVMDGYELASKLHELEPTMQLIAVTGYGQPGDFERTRASGFAAHLVKPLDIDALLETLQRLSSRPAAATLTS